MSDLRTFRSTGVNLIAWVSVGILAALMVFVGLRMPESMKFSTSGTVTMWILIGAWAVLAYGISRSKVTADSETITIVNGFKKTQFSWAEVAAISWRDGSPWPTLITREDQRLSMFGLQSSEGKSTRLAVEWLREHLV